MSVPVGYNRLLLKHFSLFLIVGAVCVSVSAQAEELTVDTVQAWLKENGAKIRDDDLTQVASVSDLAELDLSGCGNLTDNGVAHLLGLSKLKSLDLSSCRRLTPKVFETLRRMKSLEQLSAEQVGWADDVTPLAELPLLTSLSLARNTSYQGKGLSELRGLIHLDLSCGRGQFGDEGMKQLEGLRALQSLDLDGQDTITDEGIKYLAGLTDLRSLEMYGLHRITDEGFNSVFGKLKKLQNLSIAFCWWHEGKVLQLPGGIRDLDLHESKRLQLACIHSLNQPAMLCMSPHLFLSERTFHQGITVLRIFLNGLKFFNTKRGCIVECIMNRPHQFMWRQEASSIFISRRQACLHSIDKFRRNCDVDQHRLQCSRVTQFCILLKYIFPIMVYILRGRLATQEQIESDLQSVAEVGLTDISLAFHDAMKGYGYLASSFVTDCFDTPDKTAVIVSVPTIFVLNLGNNRDRQTQRQNFSHRLCISEQRFQRRLIGND